MEYDVREADRDGRSKLVRINDDGTEDDLGWDGGEPEDNLFYRSWSWVPKELNALADQLRELKKECAMFEFCFGMVKHHD